MDSFKLLKCINSPNDIKSLTHTPIEVISGSILGCFISAIYPL